MRDLLISLIERCQLRIGPDGITAKGLAAVIAVIVLIHLVLRSQRGFEFIQQLQRLLW